jgi:hypothetical protein
MLKFWLSFPQLVTFINKPKCWCCWKKQVKFWSSFLSNLVYILIRPISTSPESLVIIGGIFCHFEWCPPHDTVHLEMKCSNIMLTYSNFKWHSQTIYIKDLKFHVSLNMSEGHYHVRISYKDIFNYIEI